jgi:hypothetical protein
VAVVILAGASSPWIAQRAPRLFFPALAAVGAALVVVSLVNALVRFVRRWREEGRVRVLPLVVNIVATMFLVILPLTHLLRAMTPPGPGLREFTLDSGPGWARRDTRYRAPTAVSTSRVPWERMCSRRPTATSAWRETIATRAV